MSVATPALSREPGNRRGRAMRERLTLAALTVAERDGVEAVTVDEICRAADCSRRTFFHHFPSLDAALLGPLIPVVRPEAVQRFLADDGPILTGALALVELPSRPDADPAHEARRHALLGASPRLQAAARARLAPAAAAVLAAVTERLAREPALEAGQLSQAGRTVTALVAALVEASYAAGDDDPAAALAAITPLWGRLVAPHETAGDER